jgi:hypothetical protein
MIQYCILDPKAQQKRATLEVYAYFLDGKGHKTRPHYLI